MTITFDILTGAASIDITPAEIHQLAQMTFSDIEALLSKLPGEVQQDIHDKLKESRKQ